MTDGVEPAAMSLNATMHTASANEATDIESGSMRRAKASPTPYGSLWSLEVLVVDDDAADTSLILEVLRGHPRINSSKALDAPDVALFQLAQGWLRPNLILLDIHMPKLDGFTFLEALREIPRMQDTPVVLLTTSRHARDVELARERDVCSYVVKPDSYEELRARINSVVNQALTGRWSRS
jgi:PleD family two-component response regulator